MNRQKKLVSILAGVMAAVLLLTLVAGILPTRASAASSGEIQKQINALKEQKSEIKNQISDLKTQYQENEDEIANMVAKKNLIDQEIGLLHAEITNINEQISAYSVLVADKQEEVDHAQTRFDELNEEHRTRIRAMEEDGNLSYWEVLFKATSFSNLLDRLNMVEEIAASDKRRLKNLGEAAEQLEISRQELANEKSEVEATRVELGEAQTQLDAKRAEADELITELLAKGEEIEGLREELEKEDDDLLKEIAQKEKEYNEAKHQEWLAYMATYTTVPPATTAAPSTGGNTGGDSGGNSGGTTTTQPSSGGSWLRPCSYNALTSPFGMRNSPTTGASTYHQGVDLSAPAGTPIYASRAGVVTSATYSSSAGYYVTINHGDGFSSIYMHMTNYVVSAGQAVSAGQMIGTVGKTGIATGNHLHFGIAYNGAYVNPCAYVAL